MNTTKLALVAGTNLLADTASPVEVAWFPRLSELVANANTLPTDGLHVSVHLNHVDEFEQLLAPNFLGVLNQLAALPGVTTSFGYNSETLAQLPSEVRAQLETAIQGISPAVARVASTPQAILQAAGFNVPPANPFSTQNTDQNTGWTPPSNPFGVPANPTPPPAATPPSDPTPAPQPTPAPFTPAPAPFTPAQPAPAAPAAPLVPTPPVPRQTPPQVPAAPTFPAPAVRPVDRPAPTAQPFQPPATPAAPQTPATPFGAPPAPATPPSLYDAPQVPGGFPPAALPPPHAPGSLRPAHRCVNLLFVAPKGGTGKTTLCQNVAAYIAYHTKNMKVAYVDLNIRQGDSIFRAGFMDKNGPRNPRTVEDLYRHFANVTADNIRDFLEPVGGSDRGPWMLLPPNNAHAVDPDLSIYDAKFFSEVFELLQQAFDVIVIDTGSLEMDNPLHKLAEQIAHRVCWVIQQDRSTANITKVRIEQLLQESRHQLPYAKHGWILNAAVEGAGLTEADIFNMLRRNNSDNADHLGTIPFNVKILNANNAYQLAVELRDPEVDSYFRDIITQITKPEPIRSIQFVTADPAPQEQPDSIVGRLRRALTRR